MISSGKLIKELHAGCHNVISDLTQNSSHATSYAHCARLSTVCSNCIVVVSPVTLSAAKLRTTFSASEAIPLVVEYGPVAPPAAYGGRP